jgi:fructan beta-fructosidase
MAQILKTLTIQSRHLHLPVKNDNPKVKLCLVQEDRVLREFDVALATGPAEAVDWWAFYDVSQFMGQSLSIQVVDGGLPEPVARWLEGSLQQSDGILQAEDLYHELYRPQFHFTAKRGWNNDPNGLVYHQGEWHLYYQHNPFSVSWGNMHWGHAVSPDLAHWREMPEALFQKSLADMAFSGGAVVDRANSAGFKAGREDPIVASFTSTGRGECLAYSLDGGQTFQEYPGNPIITHHGRDPKIIWYEPGQKWVMILYHEVDGVEFNPENEALAKSIGYQILDSTDMKHWTVRDFLPGYFECPELFELPVSGQPGVKKWVILGCLWQKFCSAFVVGAFDGQKFKPEMAPEIGHYGPHHYAAQIFNHAPDDRRILIAWLSGASYPDSPFSQGMTVPLELSLRPSATGWRLLFYPVKELSLLYTGKVSGSHLDLPAANQLLASVPGGLLDIELTLKPRSPEPIRLVVGDQPIIYDPAASTITFAGQTAPLEPAPGGLALRVLVDRSVMEVFANQGEAAFSAMTIFPEGPRPIALQGSADVLTLTVHSLKSMWDDGC